MLAVLLVLVPSSGKTNMHTNAVLYMYLETLGSDKSS